MGNQASVIDGTNYDKGAVEIIVVIFMLSCFALTFIAVMIWPWNYQEVRCPIPLCENYSKHVDAGRKPFCLMNRSTGSVYGVSEEFSGGASKMDRCIRGPGELWWR